MNFTMRNAMTNLMNYIRDNNIKPEITERTASTKDVIKTYVFRLSHEISIEFNCFASIGGYIFLHLTAVDCGICIGTYSQADVPFKEADFCTEKEIHDFVMSYDSEEQS